MSKEKTEIKKFLQKLFLTILSILLVLVFFILGLIRTHEDKDISDNQQYIVKVDYNNQQYVYYCSGYTRNMTNKSFLLYKWDGTPVKEIVVHEGIYFRIELNPDYKKEYFKNKNTNSVPDKNKINT